MQAQFIQRLLHCDQQVFCCLGGPILSEQFVDEIGLLPQPQETLAELDAGVFQIRAERGCHPLQVGSLYEFASRQGRRSQRTNEAARVGQVDV